MAGGMVLLARRRAGLPGGWLAWGALLAGVGASLAANIAAANDDITARVVAGWPAVAFAVAFALRELLLIAALDPRAQVHAFDNKGTGDFSPLCPVAHRYAFGDEDEAIEYSRAPSGRSPRTVGATAPGSCAARWAAAGAAAPAARAPAPKCASGDDFGAP